MITCHAWEPKSSPKLFFFSKNIIFIFLSPKLMLKNWVGKGRSQDTKFSSCGTHLMYGNFFTSRPYCELGFWVCSIRSIHRFCGSSLPDYCILTHRVQLERKGVFSAANLLKRGVKRKRKLIGLCLAKSLFFYSVYSDFNGLGAEKHKNSENTYSLNRSLQSFYNKNRKLL